MSKCEVKFVSVDSTEHSGMSRGYAVSEDGSNWVTFEVDTLAEQEAGECCVCGEPTYEGWMNLDMGGEEAHYGCVVMPKSDEEVK